MPCTLVLGASPNPTRYSHLAVLRLIAAGQGVIAIGRREGRIADVDIRTALPQEVRVDTVTLYLSPANQRMWYEAIMAMRPRRVIFNPGTENPAFAEQLRANGVDAFDACTLVMLSTGAY